MNTKPKYPLVVELELCFPPLSADVQLEGKIVAARCQQETGLSSDVVLGLSFVPEKYDVRELKRAVEANEVRIEDFQTFCRRRGLPSDPEHARSAAEFLALAQGQRLAWLHLPAESAGLVMARTLTHWAAKNRMQIETAQAHTSCCRMRKFTSAGTVRPNPSLKRSANGRPPAPGRWHAVHFHRPGAGGLPSSPA